MGSLRLTLSTGALVLAAALTPVAAHAADGGGVQVSPSSPAPGGDITLRVTGCAGRTGAAASDAFVSDARLTAAEGGTLGGETKVRSTAHPGPYDVRITCGDTSLTSVLTVGTGGGHSAATPAAPASPTAPVRAGGGGTAHLAAVRTGSTGPGVAQTVTGLLLAAGAAVVVAARGARRNRRAG
ncbi:hypothetical protein [Streptomyces glaucescens]|uniref:Putative secreted protein n=1 Tax=Streptomyces glaucescens TaxID=1907 RepID=A0A089X9L1_STRGA|nr:hypothetical protein [Streptomyces glaucescens]AIR98576.1 putative secreted protein [Streptomyces glaucescens]